MVMVGDGVHAWGVRACIYYIYICVCVYVCPVCEHSQRKRQSEGERGSLHLLFSLLLSTFLYFGHTAAAQRRSKCYRLAGWLVGWLAVRPIATCQRLHQQHTETAEPTVQMQPQKGAHKPGQCASTGLALDAN